VTGSSGAPSRERTAPIAHGLGRLVLALSGVGYPLTQLAIRRLDRRGAVLVETVCGGLLLRDLALIALGAPRRLRSVPAVLLWFEALAAAAATVLCAPIVASEAARRHAAEPRATGLEAARRLAVGTLFGLHTVRFRIYLQPDRGRRVGPQPGASARS